MTLVCAILSATAQAEEQQEEALFTETNSIINANWESNRKPQRPASFHYSWNFKFNPFYERSELEPINIAGTFYDNVGFDNYVHTSNFEIMKQHLLYGQASDNSWRSGWRTDLYESDWSGGVGDEVRGLRSPNLQELESIRHEWLRDLLLHARASSYATVGLRLQRYDSRYEFLGTGSILGRTNVVQENRHSFFGPQMGLGVVLEGQMLRFEAVALGMVGRGSVSFDQESVFGTEAVPGALNRSATARATSTSYENDLERVVWLGETRVSAGTQHLRFDATWRWLAIGQVFDAQSMVEFSAPSFGMVSVEGDTDYVSDIFLGLTYTR